MSQRYGRPEIDRSDWWDRLWRPFWVLPGLVALLSVAIGAVLPHVDERLVGYIPYIFESGPDGARQLLGTIATAMISVTGLVFSITMVVLQLASSQFTPRLLGEFLQSRIVQLTLGVFTGSFLYALAVLRMVRGQTDTADQFVPQASVTFAFVYVVASVGLFIAFINHITSSVQLSHVVASIGARTRKVTKAMYSGERTVATWSPAPGTPRQVLRHDGDDGIVTTIDSTHLAEWGAKHDCVVALDVSVGDFVAGGQPIGTVWGLDERTVRTRAQDTDGYDSTKNGKSNGENSGETHDKNRSSGGTNSGGASGENDDDTVDLSKAASFVVVTLERGMWCDQAYGLRQLTDIAERALSPGVNDPTTAIQVIDEVYAILRPLAQQQDLSPYLVDEDGQVRGTYRVQTFLRLLDMSLGELARYAQETPRVLIRIREVTALLLDAALPQHRPPLQRLVAELADAEQARAVPLLGRDSV